MGGGVQVRWLPTVITDRGTCNLQLERHVGNTFLMTVSAMYVRDTALLDLSSTRLGRNPASKLLAGAVQAASEINGSGRTARTRA